MHELSVCQALVRQLDDIVQRERAVRITQVVVCIGPLSGVEAQLLRQAYPVASAGTAAANAELVLETLPIRVACESCGAESEATVNRLICGVCGDYHTRLLSGDELLLAQVELERDELPIASSRH
ncbi:MAG: hydrogenase maturation nickel metallochaperone HypA [Gammaproteobacteria bacterium]|nr:hydrogenase maturation nickel metallochaperone HypA [Gammaproteobacteria bacterium]